MREIPERFTDAIDLLESAARHVGTLEAIVEWPHLSPGQRVIALVIANLMHLKGQPVTSNEVAQVCGMELGRLEKIFADQEKPPYWWSEIPNKGWAFMPSQGLEYGEA